MPLKPNKRLQALQAKAVQEGRWPVAATAALALADESNLDHQINVVGAMHESGALRNQLAPFWQAWRKSEDAWTTRCLERLARGDRDYWALAALLGTNIKQTRTTFREAGYQVASVRACPVFDKAPTHLAVLTQPNEASPDAGLGQQVWAPVLEIGWDSESGELVEAGRWRAIVLEKVEAVAESTLGEGYGTYFMRAVLPHGSWRLENSKFEVARESLVPLKETLWGTD
jgi:hypothetical protein